MKVITGNRVPIKMWVTDIDNTALEQAIDLASLPFAYHHVALMPDAHAGLGMPIGGVLATKGVIVPNAVGVDIVMQNQADLVKPIETLYPIGVVKG